MSKSFPLSLGKYGEVQATFVDATTISVFTKFGLLYDGMLYTVKGSLGRHGDHWYPISGVEINGWGGGRAMKRVVDPITAIVAGNLSEFLFEHPDIIETARATLYEERLESLQATVKQEERYLKSSQERYDRAKQAVHEHEKQRGS